MTAACCIYLSFAHTRFLPLSLMGIGFYGLFGLCSKEKWMPKIVRLTVFTILCLAGYTIYFAVQQSMFGGFSYPVSRTLFSYPLGAWGNIAGTRGVVSLFPLFIWLIAAEIAWIITDKKKRMFASAILIIFLVGLFTSCTNTSYTGVLSVRHY